MASLRMEKNRLRFRLNISEIEQLYNKKELIIHNPIGGFGFLVSETRHIELRNNGFYSLFVTNQDIKELKDKSPSKDGLIFEQDNMQIHFELDIKKGLKRNII